MTDTYVEEQLIKKFLDVFSVREEITVKKFFIDNKDDLELYATNDNEFLEWYYTYINLPEEERNVDDDNLIKEIQDYEITDSEKIDENGDFRYENFSRVAFPNTPFDEGRKDIAWYELYLMSNEPQQIEVGTLARSRWIGILQVNICVPKTWGRREVNARFDEIAKTFRSGLYINGVRITKTYRTSALDDDDYYCLPVTIAWWADLER